MNATYDMLGGKLEDIKKKKIEVFGDENTAHI
jgi:hypothetical protein